MGSLSRFVTHTHTHTQTHTLTHTHIHIHCTLSFSRSPSLPFILILFVLFLIKRSIIDAVRVPGCASTCTYHYHTQVHLFWKLCEKSKCMRLFVVKIGLVKAKEKGMILFKYAFSKFIFQKVYTKMTKKLSFLLHYVVWPPHKLLITLWCFKIKHLDFLLPSLSFLLSQEWLRK